jgi:hypothetical protein
MRSVFIIIDVTTFDDIVGIASPFVDDINRNQ